MSDTLLVKNFKDYFFYLKEQIAEALNFSVTKDHPIDGFIQNLQNNLLSKINQQVSLEKNQYEKMEEESLQQGIYLQTALTDEYFLKLDWAGKDFWKKSMLEHRIFQTQHAGDVIIKNVENILKNPQKYSRGLIRLYLNIFSLGFKGKASEQDIQQYKMRLFSLLYPLDENFLPDARQPLIPDVFNYTDETPSPGFVPNIRTWALVFGAGILCYILITSIYWYHIHSDIKRITYILKERTNMKNSLGE